MACVNRKTPSSVPLIVGLVGLAFVVRLVYFLHAHQIHGDAVQFAEIARDIVAGSGGSIDSSWYQAFCLYQVPFQWLISDPLWAAAMSSMMPGALLIWPVFAITERLFSRSAAVVAGVITMLHPHLVNYSCTGYMESFYLFWFSIVTWMLVRLIEAPAMRHVVVAGAAAGIAFATRNEFIAFIAVVCAALLATIPGFVRRLLSRWSRGSELPFLQLPASKVLGLVLCLNLSAAVTTGLYATVSKQVVGIYGLFEKTGNFGRTKDIFNQRAESAKEIYGTKGAVVTEQESKMTAFGFAKSIGARFLNNLKTGMVKAVPKLLASPVYGFAVVLALVWLRRPRLRLESLPVIMMLGFTPALYSLIFVQPRYLQPMLPALNVVTGAGFVVALGAVRDLKFSIPAPALMRTALAFCIVLLAATTAWRANKARSETVIHEKVAGWVDAHIDDSEVLVGCGFGSISDTAFLSGNDSEPRLVTDSPDELAGFVREHRSHWLLLFEEFIHEANPELAPVLDTGVPGFTKMFEETDSRGRRVQVYRLANTAEGPPNGLTSATTTNG